MLCLHIFTIRDLMSHLVMLLLILDVVLSRVLIEGASTRFSLHVHSSIHYLLFCTVLLKVKICWRAFHQQAPPILSIVFMGPLGKSSVHCVEMYLFLATKVVSLWETISARIYFTRARSTNCLASCKWLGFFCDYVKTPASETCIAAPDLMWWLIWIAIWYAFAIVKILVLNINWLPLLIMQLALNLISSDGIFNVGIR